MDRIADQKTIGLRIAKIRTDMGKSQESFSEILGVSRNTMGTIEHGDTAPSLATLIRLFENTETTPSQLFYSQKSLSGTEQIKDMMATMTSEEKQEFLRSASYLASGIIAKRKDENRR